MPVSGFFQLSQRGKRNHDGGDDGEHRRAPGSFLREARPREDARLFPLLRSRSTEWVTDDGKSKRLAVSWALLLVRGWEVWEIMQWVPGNTLGGKGLFPGTHD